MANSYNQNPIIITTTMGAGWRSLQTLNTGTNPSGNSAQIGIKVSKVVWTGATAAGHTFVIEEPKSSIVLLQGQAGTPLTYTEYDFTAKLADWRDFQVTTLASGTLLIYYRT